MADRFFLADLRPNELAILEGDEAHHLARVRRLASGDVVELFDGKGLAVRSEIVEVRKSAVTLRPLEILPVPAEPAQLTLAVAVPKGERFGWLVEKAVEVGVARLVPILAERSTVDPRGSKLERLRRTVLESSKQCGRSRLMTLEDPRRFDDYLAAERASRRFFAHPGAAAILSVLATGDARSPAAVLIGPEGGFTEEEAARAGSAGWTPVGLGVTIMRIETATLAAAALVMAYAEAKGDS